MIKSKKNKKKLEFAKIILAIYAFACIVWVQQNYFLAFLDKMQTNESVTITIIGSLGAAIIGYYTKSLLEKSSRNKYGISESGLPFEYSESSKNSSKRRGSLKNNDGDGFESM